MNVLAPWANYFIAEAGAAGALTGLIFVALSLNLDQILAEGAWLDRAATGLPPDQRGSGRRSTEGTRCLSTALCRTGQASTSGIHPAQPK